jgi:hypothetical protein
MIKNSEWVMEELPPEHKDMIFFSPDCRENSFYSSKETSMFSILNDPSDSLHSILKALRDNNSLFFKKISKVSLSLKTFNLEKQKKVFRSEIEKAVNNYVLTKYNVRSKNNKSKNIDKLKILSEKINKNNTFIYNYDVIKSLNLFNNESLLIYYCPTQKDIKEKDHYKILDVLLKHYSKVIIHTYDNKLYKKYFKNWNKKKKPNQKNKFKIECIWKNF